MSRVNLGARSETCQRPKMYSPGDKKSIPEIASPELNSSSAQANMFSAHKDSVLCIQFVQQVNFDSGAWIWNFIRNHVHMCASHMFIHGHCLKSTSPIRSEFCTVSCSCCTDMELKAPPIAIKTFAAGALKWAPQTTTSKRTCPI